MFTQSRLIACATMLTIGLMAVNAEMIVRTKDGRTFKVQIDSGEIESITFTGPYYGAPIRPESLPFGSASNLGSVWRTREISGSTIYEAVWTRRGSSSTFDGVWSRGGVTATLTLESVSGSKVVFSRPGIGRYTGTLSPDGRRITAGTMDWAPGFQWTATIE
jgi:hypothetical protein